MEKKYDSQPDIKIFVACHKPSYVADNVYLYPIQVGAALAKTRLDMLHDDEGENISGKNKSYCELTAQYWAWKNIEADYYGFFIIGDILYSIRLWSAMTIGEMLYLTESHQKL